MQHIATRKLNALATILLNLNLVEDVMGKDTDAALLVFLMQQAAQIVIEGGEDILATVDDSRLDAEAVEDAGEFEADIARTRDDDAFWQFLARSKAASDTIPCSWPSSAACGLGVPPTAIRMRSALTVRSSVFSQTSCGPRNSARVSNNSTPLPVRPFL